MHCIACIVIYIVLLFFYCMYCIIILYVLQKNSNYTVGSKFINGVPQIIRVGEHNSNFENF